MNIAQEFIEIIKSLKKKLSIPSINEVFFPQKGGTDPNLRYNNFGAIKLQDNSIGIIYLGLSDKVKSRAQKFNTDKIKGKNPLDLAQYTESDDLFQRTLAFGAINAISQSFLDKVNYSHDFTTDSLGLLDLKGTDFVGMVGFFPPLVKKIKKRNIPLVIIEKKEKLIQKHENWEITLDPSRLNNCNKVLCTSSTVLNNSLDEILSYCKNAEKVSIVGPSAGFLPDPLFKRGVDVLGGTYLSDPPLFMDLISQNKKWGRSANKYCIQADHYPGFRTLLEKC
jgi:uncharacterized protein (DUF4213/DUF364 family)